MKIKFWSGKNILVGLKGLASSVVAGLVIILPVWLVRWLIQIKSMNVLGMALGIAFILFYYHTWGWLSRKWWRWN